MSKRVVTTHKPRANARNSFFIPGKMLSDAAAELPAHCAIGGAYRDRTDDLMLAKQPLSQLS